MRVDGFKHLLNEGFPPGSRRGHPTASNRSVCSALHHQLPQVSLLLLHLLLLLLLLLLPLLLGIHQGNVSVRLFAPLGLVTHLYSSQRSLHSSPALPTTQCHPRVKISEAKPWILSLGGSQLARAGRRLATLRRDWSPPRAPDWCPEEWMVGPSAGARTSQDTLDRH